MGTERALLMRCYFVKNARIVALKELPDLPYREAVETARRMFEDDPSCDGVEVWSLTRRICWLGHIAGKSRATPSATKRHLRLVA